MIRATIFTYVPRHVTCILHIHTCAFLNSFSLCFFISIFLQLTTQQLSTIAGTTDLAMSGQLKSRRDKLDERAAVDVAFKAHDNDARSNWRILHTCISQRRHRYSIKAAGNDSLNTRGVKSANGKCSV